MVIKQQASNNLPFSWIWLGTCEHNIINRRLTLKNNVYRGQEKLPRYRSGLYQVKQRKIKPRLHKQTSIAYAQNKFSSYANTIQGPDWSSWQHIINYLFYGKYLLTYVYHLNLVLLKPSLTAAILKMPPQHVYYILFYLPTC